MRQIHNKMAINAEEHSRAGGTAPALGAGAREVVSPWGWWSLVGLRSSGAMCIPLGQHLLLLPDPKSYTEKILILGGVLEGWMPECCFFLGPDAP